MVMMMVMVGRVLDFRLPTLLSEINGVRMEYVSSTMMAKPDSAHAAIHVPFAIIGSRFLFPMVYLTIAGFADVCQPAYITVSYSPTASADTTSIITTIYLFHFEMRVSAQYTMVVTCV